MSRPGDAGSLAPPASARGACRPSPSEPARRPCGEHGREHAEADEHVHPEEGEVHVLGPALLEIEQHAAAERDDVGELPLSAVGGFGALGPFGGRRAEGARRVGLAARQLGIVRARGIALKQYADPSRPVDDGADAWRPVTQLTPPPVRVEAQPLEPVRVVEELQPVSCTQVGDGVQLLDFGQHLTGRVRLTVNGPAGAQVLVRHGEALDAAGALYTANLRTATQANTFTLAGGGAEVLEPEFTIQGFRYAEVTGPIAPLRPVDASALVLHSDLAVTGVFRTSDPLLGRIHHNVVWSQKSNFVSIPVDCSQRDERLGWTGDIHLFADTAAFVMDCSRFLASWVRSLTDGQLPDGSIPDVAPYPHTGAPLRWLKTAHVFPNVAALQALYGAEAYAAGGSTYTLLNAKGGALSLGEGDVQIGRAYYCIWDSGGEDAIDYRSAGKSVLINLNDATLDTSGNSAELATLFDQIRATNFFSAMSKSLKAGIFDEWHNAGGFFSQVLNVKNDRFVGADGDRLDVDLMELHGGEPARRERRESADVLRWDAPA